VELGSDLRQTVCLLHPSDQPVCIWTGSVRKVMLRFCGYVAWKAMVPECPSLISGRL
jgi:hypothetical protein